MRKYFATFMLLLCCVGSICAAHDFVFPLHWLMGDTNVHVIENGTLQYSSPYKGNVCIPPYVYEYLEWNHNAHKCTIVSSICGSSHDGTWVQAPRKSVTTRAGWYYDGAFLNADMDTLRLPHTITDIGDGGFENGRMKVLVIGAVTPPKFNARYAYPAFQAKLIVPSGSLQAYKEHESWGRFSQIIEGAESYFPAQMVQVDEAWYEIYGDEGKLIASNQVRGTLNVPDEIHFLSSSYPVTELGDYSIYKYSVETVNLGRNIRSFSADCLPNVRVEFDYYADKKPILDSINVATDNPYLGSAGGAVYTKDFEELIYMPLDVRRKDGVHTHTKYYTLVNGIRKLRDNSVFSLQDGEDRGDRDIVLVFPVPKGIMSFGTGTTSNAYCLYLVSKTPDILPSGQIPIFYNDITAYWMEESQEYDLQILDMQNQKDYVLDPKIEYGPMCGIIKTIGKYCLNARDQALPMLRYRWLSMPELYFRMEKKDYLESLDIQEGVEEIYGMFYGCKLLKQVRLPQSLKVIGYQTFYNCKALECITIPEGVRIIGTSNFTGCKKLTNIYVESVTPPAIYDPGYETEDAVHSYDQVFAGISSNATLHVPYGCKQAYMDSPVWSEFANIVDDAQTGISDISYDSKRQSVGIWSINGQKGQRRGLNIVRYHDGTVRKVISK